MKNIFRILIASVIFSCLFLVAQSQAAALYCHDGDNCYEVNESNLADCANISETPCSTSSSSGASAQPTSKIIPACLLGNNIDGSCDNINIFITFAINIGIYIFGFIGALALLMFVYGGFILIMSQGNQEKVKKGTGAITAAVIGLVIAFSAYALITFLSNTIGVKSGKSINFVETVFAQSSEEGNGCIIDGKCIILSDPGEFCGDPCNYDLELLTPVELNEMQDVLEGGQTKPAQKGISSLVAGAKKLNPMQISSPYSLLAGGVNILLAFMGSIALLLYIYAGFIWMSAGGSADKITKAKKILIWTTFGILAMTGSYMVVNTILKQIG